MTRGRKKDLTIPPSRTLVQQRDYRARKANYVAGLEDRCRKAEEENVTLRRELAEARARLVNPALLLPDTAQASSELLNNLRAATASLSRFQELAFASSSNTPVPVEPPRNYTEPTLDAQLHPYFADNRQSTEFSQAPAPPTGGRKRLFIETTPPVSPESVSRRSISPQSNNTGSRSSSEECCGGILDCDALRCDGILEHDSERSVGKISRMSGMRSTSDHRLQSS
ncbi:hypothetical protein D9619_001520 [Psilocybe cf. subviscida]|uniref:BZIP domain-containing protein n=1 Tax=Psilocybe cf. subviscida TaxID=2480587 RepID=A0A8H5BE47_9AGAR|nr:hypothetical protein D9619_001520 [Psilocybe cf. subviscida]